jgi:hypothetical protein
MSVKTIVYSSDDEDKSYYSDHGFRKPSRNKYHNTEDFDFDQGSIL